MRKRIEKENIELAEIKNLTELMTKAVEGIEDPATWITLSFTLRDMEPIVEKIKKMETGLQNKHFLRDKDGDLILKKVPVIDSNGNILTEKIMEGEKEVERPMMQEVKQFKDPAKFQIEYQDMMATKMTIEWNHRIKMSDIQQFPAGLKKLQYKLLDRVIVTDDLPL